MQFNNEFKLWCHYEKDNWNIDGYKMIYKINDSKSFWELYNNWDNIGGVLCKQFFLMKNNINPRWEDKANRNGGCWSFKLNLEDYKDIWEMLSILFVVGELSKEYGDINGLSICLKKNDKIVIKIWNSSKNKNQIENLNRIIFDEYNPEIIYIANNPNKE
tara:strand:+ start:74 stop:553 length:480 start_codon:yes stop_codon:yes gene_type:complete